MAELFRAAASPQNANAFDCVTRLLCFLASFVVVVIVTTYLWLLQSVLTFALPPTSCKRLHAKSNSNSP